MEAAGAVSPIAFAGVSLVLGLLVGSFLNVVVYRLPRGESIAWPGSHCPACKHAIAPYDNVPVLSYLWLRGRCRHCRAPIALRYPLFELATGICFGGIAIRHGLTPMTGIWMLFAAALLAQAAIDFEHRIIPDEISLGGLVFGLVAIPALQAATGGDAFAAATDAALGALLGGGLLWLVGFLHARVAVAMGREFPHWPEEGEDPPRPNELDYWTWFPGLGFGDVKLLAMIGAFLGPVGVMHTIFLAALVGLALGLAFALRRGDAGQPFGFGPAIAVAALAIVLFPSLSTLVL